MLIRAKYPDPIGQPEGRVSNPISAPPAPFNNSIIPEHGQSERRRLRNINLNQIFYAASLVSLIPRNIE